MTSKKPENLAAALKASLEGSPIAGPERDLITGPVKLQISGPEDTVIALVVVLKGLPDDCDTNHQPDPAEALGHLGVSLSKMTSQPRNRKNQAAGTSTWEVTFDASPAGEQQ